MVDGKVGVTCNHAEEGHYRLSDSQLLQAQLSPLSSGGGYGGSVCCVDTPPENIH